MALVLNCIVLEPKAVPKYHVMELRLGVLCAALTIAMAAALPQDVSQCGRQCNLALVYFNVSEDLNPTQGTSLGDILNLFDNVLSVEDVSSYNPMDPPITADYIQSAIRIRIPLPSCSCRRLPDGTPYLGLVFNYTVGQGDTYDRIAKSNYSGLTTSSWLQRANTIATTSLKPGNVLNISINCSCGDPKISKDYGLFMTYPLARSFNDTLANISSTFGVPANLIRRYNPNVDFNNFNGIAFIPVQDNLNSYRPLGSASGGGFGTGAVIGVCIAGAVGLVIIALGLHFYRHKKAKGAPLLQPPNNNPTSYTQDLMVDKSVEFTYEELAYATNNFSLANKIGEGAFGAVYYGEVRGEKAAIKKMKMESTHEFMAELKVLTHVHHLNLVRLIGFCTEESLFLVYELIENGNLSQHLCSSEMEPLSWAARVQIALDSARALEYIHEHTVPVYIHRDIKSANILIDKNFRAKVADFGLTKLKDAAGQSSSLLSNLVGTFGYIPPEYAQFGEVSPKVDVYAFGVVLYELISAKEAILRPNETFSECKALVVLFEDVWEHANGHEALKELIDPRLENYQLESVWKMAMLAKACTQKNPELRPTMRTVVIGLMTLSSLFEEWSDGSVCENKRTA